MFSPGRRLGRRKKHKIWNNGVCLYTASFLRLFYAHCFLPFSFFCVLILRLYHAVSVFFAVWAFLHPHFLNAQDIFVCFKMITYNAPAVSDITNLFRSKPYRRMFFGDIIKTRFCARFGQRYRVKIYFFQEGNLWTFFHCLNLFAVFLFSCSE